MTRLFACVACSILLSQSLRAESRFEEQVVFRAGDNGYPVYRIPSAIVTPRGTLLVFAEARAALSDSGEINIVMKRSTDNGRTFSAQRVVWADGKNTCGNP